MPTAGTTNSSGFWRPYFQKSIRAYETYVRPSAESKSQYQQRKRTPISLKASETTSPGSQWSSVIHWTTTKWFSAVFAFWAQWEEGVGELMMYDIPANELSVNAIEFLMGADDIRRRGKLKRRISIARVLVRSDFLIYSTLKDFNLLLGKLEDVASISARACRTPWTLTREVRESKGSGVVLWRRFFVGGGGWGRDGVLLSRLQQRILSYLSVF